MKTFKIDLSQTVLDDLQMRLRNTRWPDEVAGSGWEYGTNLSYMKDLVSYWLNGFNWRTQEKYLNSFSQYGYGHIQGTRPQTLAYGLNDSPAGLAAWIVEKYRAWSDCNGDIESRFTKDELLTNITLYWATQTIHSSMRHYYHYTNKVNSPPPLEPGEKITVPTGVAMFPGEKDLIVPKHFADRTYNIIHWTDMPSGGHFAAIEEPELLVNDLRKFARNFR